MKVKVKIAVAIDSDCNWNSCGWGSPDEDNSSDCMSMAVDPLLNGEKRYWIEAIIDTPSVETVIGDVYEES